MASYRMAKIAMADLRRIAMDTRRQWGKDQALKYVAEMQEGFQHIADRHDALPQHSRLTGASKLRLHRIASHYICYLIMTPDLIIITGMLHERMDIPARLRELQTLTENDIGDLRAKLLRDMLRGD